MSLLTYLQPCTALAYYFVEILFIQSSQMLNQTSHTCLYDTSNVCCMFLLIHIEQQSSSC